MHNIAKSHVMRGKAMMFLEHWDDIWAALEIPTIGVYNATLWSRPDQT